MKKESQYSEHLYALILAGGGGTRLWPKSREKTPKQFLKLFNNETLMQVTARRFSTILPWDRIFCVTVSEEYKEEVLAEVPELHPENVIVEPARRETAPAHGLGALYIHKKDPDAVIITEAADRLVKPVPLYLKTLKAAAEVAYEKQLMLTVGVEPRYPHVGYGHIKKGKKWGRTSGVDIYELDAFVEKPALEDAKKYTASGDYYWNAGQFVWRADTILEALGRHEPEIKKQLDSIEQALGSESEAETLKKAYNAMPKISIDYAVAEREKKFLVVEAPFFWTDIGDWKEVWENLLKDNQGNVIIDGEEDGGDIISLDTSDALIHTNGRLIAAIDVDNVVIVDTKDALLVCSKSRAQNVKKIVETLKELKRTEVL